MSTAEVRIQIGIDRLRLAGNILDPDISVRNPVMYPGPDADFCHCEAMIRLVNINAVG